MTKLPLEVQTLYAELLDGLVASEAKRTIGNAPGCFVTKVVKGETYLLLPALGAGRGAPPGLCGTEGRTFGPAGAGC